MPHYVKCLYCGETFDRDKVEWIQPQGRRYAHKVCPNPDPNKKKLEQEKDDFWQYVKKIYGPGYNFIKLNAFAEKYIRENKFTWSGMLKALKWFYEIQKSPKNNLDYETIGIIPFIYEDAKKYYKGIFDAQKKNKDVVVRRAQPMEVSIQSPRAFHPRPRLFDLDKED